MSELQTALGVVAAASFKHVRYCRIIPIADCLYFLCSPAGAAIAVPLTPELAEAYEVVGKTLTPTVCHQLISISHSFFLKALAYIRARNADPMCRFSLSRGIFQA